MDLLEKIAKALHDGWVKYKIDQGFQYGPVRHSERKLHPHLVEWEKLDDVEAMNQDRFQAALIIEWHRSRHISDKEALAVAIHNAWVTWTKIHRESHPHALPYLDAHRQDVGEHVEQANLVWPILTKIPQF